MQTTFISHDNLQLNQSELIWGFGISWDKRGWEGGWFSRKIGRFFKMIISPCLVLFRWRWCLLDFTDEGSNAGKIGRACKVFSLASQCGTYRNLPSYFFDKNFVKATFLSIKLQNSWFHEIRNFIESQFLIISHCGPSTFRSKFFPLFLSFALRTKLLVAAKCTLVTFRKANWAFKWNGNLPFWVT